MKRTFDERTQIPLMWVLCAYVPTTTFVISVALWVFNVDTRLSRIENKLGIDAPKVAEMQPSKREASNAYHP